MYSYRFMVFRHPLALVILPMPSVTRLMFGQQIIEGAPSAVRGGSLCSLNISRQFHLTISVSVIMCVPGCKETEDILAYLPAEYNECFRNEIFK